MKSEAGKSGDATQEEYQIDLQEVARAVLKTVVHLEKPYGAAYIARLLRADGPQYIKSPDHMKFETVGSITHMSRTELRLCMQRLMEKGYLEPVNASLARLKISDRGRTFLESPATILVDRSEIRMTPQETYVHRRLLDYRMATSKELGTPSYQIFNDMTLDYLAKECPLKESYLLGIGNLNEFRVEKYGADIVKTVKNALEDFSDIRRIGLDRRINHVTHQRVLRLHEEGKEPGEISGILGIKEATVHGYLVNFHHAGYIDIRPAVEKWVDGKTLFRCTEFFRRAPEASISDAVRALQVSYATCRLAKAYISDFQPRRESIAA